VNSTLKSKITIVLGTLLCVVLSTSSHAAVKSIAGTACKKSGTKQVIAGKSYLCSSVGKKLVWKVKPSVTPQIPLGPTWAQIEAEKAAVAVAAAAKAAEELRLKLEAEAKAIAEAKAAAELKAKQEAEEKLAKAEAEKPKIQGLTIGNLLWSDEFIGAQGSTVDQKNWTARNCHRTPTSLGGGACFDSEVVYYAPSAVKLDGSNDGTAVISTTRIKGALPSDAGTCLTSICAFVSGRFDTHGKVAFQYGFIEARIKMPSGSGNHPAFWMLGDNINQVGWPTSGEMDITEIHSNNPQTTTSATHYSINYAPNTCCSNHFYKVDGLFLGVDVSVDYHTYAVAWLPDSISYYVDNKLISTTTPQTLGGYWSFNDKFFLILNNAVNAGFSGSWENLLSSTMSIDWVRSYQLNGQGQVFTQ
jgi:beta-glucanase (GH16 family)